jgi:hypothetical protein
MSRPRHFLAVSTKTQDADLDLEAKTSNFLFLYTHSPSFLPSRLLLLAPSSLQPTWLRGHLCHRPRPAAPLTFPARFHDKDEISK